MTMQQQSFLLAFLVFQAFFSLFCTLQTRSMTSERCLIRSILLLQEIYGVMIFSNFTAFYIKTDF